MKQSEKRMACGGRNGKGRRVRRRSERMHLKRELFERGMKGETKGS